ncbi:hypothetical protein ACMFMG_010752 [Clarireedia jacksonii]
MAFMVKNPGLMPGFDSLKSGDVGKRRKGMEEIVLGCWRSCIEAGDGMGPAPIQSGSQTSLGLGAGIHMDTNPTERPFIADAIIANPPSFAHIHIAEKLGIPLHMMFTMPWSPTQSFPHPLANIQSSNADVNMTNFISYALVEMMTWQGLGDVINRFRERALGLDPISLIWAPGMLTRLRIPYTYCWSPALIPKPKDWGKHISISGFYFLSLASSFTPNPDLAAFLAAGPPPVYIGFGSIVVDDPNGMTKLIFEAVKKAGVRALVSKGWGGLGADDLDKPDGVFMLGNVPHDWLFKHVSCVVHHGGAGTTAAGIALGRPTVVVPFFGDQPFWGAMTARAGAGPPPIPYKQLTSDKLAAAITEALKPETLSKAQELGERIKEEKGTECGAKSFHDNLNYDNMRCSLAPHRVAVWRIKRTQTKLSALAANVLADANLISFADLKMYRPREYEADDGPWDPITGGASALIGTIASLGMGVADFPIEIFKTVRSKKEAHAHAHTHSRDSSGATSGTPKSTVPNRSHRPSALDEQSLRSVNASLQQASDSSGKVSYESGHNYSEPATPTTPVSSTDSVADVPSPGMKHATSFKEGIKNHIQQHCGTGSGTATPKEFDPSKLTLENAIGAGKGISRIIGAGMKSPMDFTLGIARGFHNAPKLYGDDTVRPQAKVTDFQSGLKAAGKEFGYGMFDGITGLVTQPMRGAEKEGAAGLLKGIGKGIGGLVLKPGAAIWGLPGYTFMGINKEIKKIFGSSALNYIIAARTAQGYEDAQKCNPKERADIIQRWHEHKSEYQNIQQKIHEEGPDGQNSGHLSPKGFLQTRHLTFDERKKLHEERKIKREVEHKKNPSAHHHRCPFCRRASPHSHEHRPLQDSPVIHATTGDGGSHPDFEEAIQASVAATSRGNTEEDQMIERALRASVRELQGGQSSQLSDQETLDRAIQASIAASRADAERDGAHHDDDDDAKHQKMLAKAIQESLRHYQMDEAKEAESTEYVPHINLQDNEDEDDEDMKAAIQRSKEESQAQATTHGGMTEEEIVLEYVKKQSLAEEEHRKMLAEKKKEKEASSSDADDEAFRQAIEESLKSSGGGPSSSA